MRFHVLAADIVVPGNYLLPMMKRRLRGIITALVISGNDRNGLLRARIIDHPHHQPCRLGGEGQ